MQIEINRPAMEAEFGAQIADLSKRCAQYAGANASLLQINMALEARVRELEAAQAEAKADTPADAPETAG